MRGYCLLQSPVSSLAALNSLATKSERVKLKSVQLYLILLLVNSLIVTDTVSKYLGENTKIFQFISGTVDYTLVRVATGNGLSDI